MYVRKTTELMKDIKEELKWRYILYSWIGRLSAAKISVLANLVYDPVQA